MHLSKKVFLYKKFLMWRLTFLENLFVHNSEVAKKVEIWLLVLNHSTMISRLTIRQFKFCKICNKKNRYHEFCGDLRQKLIRKYIWIHEIGQIGKFFTTLIGTQLHKMCKIMYIYIFRMFWRSDVPAMVLLFEQTRDIYGHRFWGIPRFDFRMTSLYKKQLSITSDTLQVERIRSITNMH